MLMKSVVYEDVPSHAPGMFREPDHGLWGRPRSLSSESESEIPKICSSSHLSFGKDIGVCFWKMILLSFGHDTVTTPPNADSRWQRLRMLPITNHGDGFSLCHVKYHGSGIASY